MDHSTGCSSHLDPAGRWQRWPVQCKTWHWRWTEQPGHGGGMQELALDAVRCVATTSEGRQEIDIKKYAKVEKIPGGDITESRVLKGVMFQKDVVAPGRMRRCQSLLGQRQ